MDELHAVEHNSLLRPVGPRQAATNGHASRAEAHSRSARTPRRPTALLEPLGSARAAPSMLAAAAAASAAAASAPSAPAASASASGSLSARVAPVPPLVVDDPSALDPSSQARFVAALWRESRALARSQQEAALRSKRERVRGTKAGREGNANGNGVGSAEEKSASAPFFLPDMRPTAAGHRPSFLLSPPSPTAPPPPSLPPAPDVLASIDGLLNPRSVVHRAAAMSVEAEQAMKQEAAAHVGNGGSGNSLAGAGTGGANPSAARALAAAHSVVSLRSESNYGPQHAAQAAATHAQRAAAQSPRVRMTHAAMLRSSAVSARTRSSSPSAAPSSAAPSSSAYLSHVLDVWSAWRAQLSFLGQFVYAAKAADLGLSTHWERRDAFLSRMLADSNSGVLWLEGQGLGRASARAIATFLRKVAAFAAPTPQEREARKFWIRGGKAAGVRLRARNRLHGDIDSGEDEDEFESTLHTASNSDSSAEEGEEHDERGGAHSAARSPEIIDTEELLRRSYETALSSPSAQRAANDAKRFEWQRPAGGGDGAALEDAHGHAQNSSATPSPRSQPSLTSSRTAGLASGVLLTSVPPSSANLRDGVENSSDAAIEHKQQGSESDSTAASPPPPYSLLGVPRRPFHTLLLSSNNLCDGGALELATLFLPNPRQAVEDSARLAVARASKVERRRLRRERRATRARAREMGLDLDGATGDDETLWPLSSLHTLVLRSNNLTAPGFAVLFDSLAHARAPLARLDLSAHSAVRSGDVDASRVGGAGGGGGSSIGLGSMFIGLEGCHSAGVMLERNTRLRTLLLANVGMGAVKGGVEMLAAGLARNRTLRLLDLSSNRISCGPELSALVEAASVSALRELRFSHNPVGNLGACLFASLVSRSATLTALRFECCEVGAPGLALLTRALEHASVLRDVHMDGNMLLTRALPSIEPRDAGAAAAAAAATVQRLLSQANLLGLSVAPALGANLSLHTLNLNAANVDDKTVSDLCSALESHCTLHSLYLRSNRIGDEGGEVLGKLLRYNRVLQHLDLYMNFIGDVGGMAIAQACAAGATINVLNMQNNHLSNASGDAFLSALHRNPNLCTLLLDGNALDYRLYSRLVDSASRNRANWSRVLRPRLHALLRTLLRDKARLREVSFARDRAATVQENLDAHLRALTEGVKSARAAVLSQAETLSVSLTRLRAQSGESAAELRAFNAYLASEESKRESRLHELSVSLSQERSQTSALRKKIRKGAESISGADKKPAAVERTNLETILRSERKKLDAARSEAAQLQAELEAFLTQLQREAAPPPPPSKKKGGAAKRTTAAATGAK